ncbi:MAG: DUF393 domain-containing protein, partial [Anaerolineales bacterium]|nr:DUF393 domain-containing protein [Candidatus Desulfolinea nitratireducens]
MKNNNIIIFDGVCNLCNWSVQFIVKRDFKNIFKFATAQSEFGISILERNGYSIENPESILLIRNGKVLEKSDAALEIASELEKGWKALVLFRIFPKRFRDFLYDWIA